MQVRLNDLLQKWPIQTSNSCHSSAQFLPCLTTQSTHLSVFRSTKQACPWFRDRSRLRQEEELSHPVARHAKIFRLNWPNNLTTLTTVPKRRLTQSCNENDPNVSISISKTTRNTMVPHIRYSSHSRDYSSHSLVMEKEIILDALAICKEDIWRCVDASPWRCSSSCKAFSESWKGCFWKPKQHNLQINQLPGASIFTASRPCWQHPLPSQLELQSHRDVLKNQDTASASNTWLQHMTSHMADSFKQPNCGILMVLILFANSSLYDCGHVCCKWHYLMSLSLQFTTLVLGNITVDHVKLHRPRDAVPLKNADTSDSQRHKKRNKKTNFIYDIQETYN